MAAYSKNKHLKMKLTGLRTIVKLINYILDAFSLFLKIELRLLLNYFTCV